MSLGRLRIFLGQLLAARYVLRLAFERIRTGIDAHAVGRERPVSSGLFEFYFQL